jgi:hypothetical protein
MLRLRRAHGGRTIVFQAKKAQVVIVRIFYGGQDALGQRSRIRPYAASTPSKRIERLLKGGVGTELRRDTQVIGCVEIAAAPDIAMTIRSGCSRRICNIVPMPSCSGMMMSTTAARDRRATEDPETFAPIASGAHLEVVRLDDDPKRVQHGRIVIDDQDRRRVIGRGRAGGGRGYAFMHATSPFRYSRTIELKFAPTIGNIESWLISWMGPFPN